MKKILILLYIVANGSFVLAQSRPSPIPAGMSQKELERLSKMSPAELEKYQKEMIRKAEQQIKDYARAGNIHIDESRLQSTEFVLPAKDPKRIAAIPPRPLTQAELVAQIRRSLTALKKIAPLAVTQQCDSVVSGNPVTEIEGAAITQWYRNDSYSALRLAMEAAQKKPEDILVLNNLAALYNLAGLQHQAIPILQYSLTQAPRSSLLLNNMGQAWLGLGETTKATQYFNKCLTVDSLNPEANRSMAMISLHHNEYDKAVKYFAREATITYRASSLASLAKAENRDKLDLLALRQEKMKREGTPRRDFFEEISLSKFALPQLPLTCDHSDSLQRKSRSFRKAVDQEIRFWAVAGLPTKEQSIMEGKRSPGIYDDLVRELLTELDRTYLPLLQLFTEDDLAQIQNLNAEFARKWNEITCPAIPSGPGTGADLILAYEKKCCDKKKPIIDDYLRKHNELVKTRIGIVQPRWKEYINAVVSIAQLDPSIANKLLVSSKINLYFVFLENAAGAGLYMSPPGECHMKMSSAEADAIILQAKHDFEFQCPGWFKIEIPVKAATIKLDCDAFAIEADLYGLLHAGIEKQFKSGTSTLWVSAGVDAEFAKYGKVEMTAKLYITWDQNNKFSDVGLKGTGAISLDQVGSAEFGYGFGLNAGFNSQTEVKNELRESFEKAIGYIK